MDIIIYGIRRSNSPTVPLKHNFGWFAIQFSCIAFVLSMFHKVYMKINEEGGNKNTFTCF